MKRSANSWVNIGIQMNKNILALSLVAIIGQGVVAQSNNIEEIVVTATKTERTLQEVPVAVSVVTADTIEKANIVDLSRS